MKLPALQGGASRKGSYLFHSNQGPGQFLQRHAAGLSPAKPNSGNCLTICPPADDNHHCPDNRHRSLPFGAAIALCRLKALRRSSCRAKNTPLPELAFFCLRLKRRGLRGKQLGQPAQSNQINSPSSCFSKFEAIVDMTVASCCYGNRKP